ncbi:hypothetical protein [Couchioplanes azureus]|uniref:hypothetical protein n=1 Tax=Couchioplanes caeruleus TaxID=56438 RepID=UPI00166FBD5C|nr:hypothetical protein [Couchioplanes caeruleus]
MTSKPRFAATVVTAAAGIVLAAGAPAGAAPADPAAASLAVQVAADGQLRARGAAVTVPIDVVCSEGAATSWLSMEVIQRAHGGEVGRAFAYLERLPCDGTMHTVELTATAQTLAFHPGAAYVTAVGSVCAPDACVNVQKAGELQLRR